MQALIATQALRRAAAQAGQAPSIHNTQPWRFVVTGSALEVRADRTRQLRVLDPLGRQLLVSCGCALFNARVSLAAAGYDAAVARFPDPYEPDLLARVSLRDSAGRPEIGELDWAIAQRQTNRRAFLDERVPAEVVDTLTAAAAAEEAELAPVTSIRHRLAVGRLSQQADRIENADPAYRAELRAWTTDDPRRTDGVPSLAVPHVDAGSGDEVPIRDFDTRGTGALPTQTRSTMSQCLLLLGTTINDRLAWLRAGEALERVLLEITRHGYSASPLTQMIEVAQTNELLRAELPLAMYPHVLLRVGHAQRTPQVRRRRLVDVLTDLTDVD